MKFYLRDFMFYDIFLVETKLRVKNSPSFFNFKNFFVEKISGFYIDFFFIFLVGNVITARPTPRRLDWRFD